MPRQLQDESTYRNWSRSVTEEGGEEEPSIDLGIKINPSDQLSLNIYLLPIITILRIWLDGNYFLTRIVKHPRRDILYKAVVLVSFCRVARTRKTKPQFRNFGFRHKIK